MWYSRVGIGIAFTGLIKIRVVMIKRLNDKNFDKEVLKFDKLYLVVLEKKWSGTNEIIKPMLKRLMNSFSDDLKIGRLDVESNEEICKRYSIKSNHEFIIFIKGRISKIISEIMPYKMLKENIDEILHQLYR